jgi:hypothetical protein
VAAAGDLPADAAGDANRRRFVTPAPSATPLPTATPTPIVAQPGEQLIVIAPFVGYTSSDLQFNVAGRIREAVEEELQRARWTTYTP